MRDPRSDRFAFRDPKLDSLFDTIGSRTSKSEAVGLRVYSTNTIVDFRLPNGVETTIFICFLVAVILHLNLDPVLK